MTNITWLNIAHEEIFVSRPRLTPARILFTLDKLLAFARTIIILRQFQLSSQLDSFYFADLLPSWEVAIFSGSALAMAMIPVLTSNPDFTRARIRMEFIFTRCQSCFSRDRHRRGAGRVFALPIVRLWIAPGVSAEQQLFHCETDAH